MQARDRQPRHGHRVWNRERRPQQRQQREGDRDARQVAETEAEEVGGDGERCNGGTESVLPLLQRHVWHIWWTNRVGSRMRVPRSLFKKII